MVWLFFFFSPEERMVRKIFLLSIYSGHVVTDGFITTSNFPLTSLAVHITCGNYVTLEMEKLRVGIKRLGWIRMKTCQCGALKIISLSG